MKGSWGFLARFDGFAVCESGPWALRPYRPSIGFESVGPAATRAQKLSPPTLHLRFLEVKGLGFRALVFGG